MPLLLGTNAGLTFTDIDRELARLEAGGAR